MKNGVKKQHKGIVIAVSMVLLIVLITGAFTGLYFWQKSKEPSEDIKPSSPDTILTSEKYGTFVVPKNAQIQMDIFGNGFFWQNNTDFTYLTEEVYNTYFMMNKEKYPDFNNFGIGFLYEENGYNQFNTRDDIATINDVFNEPTIGFAPVYGNFVINLLFMPKNNLLNFDLQAGNAGQLSPTTDFVNLKLFMFDKTSLEDDAIYENCKNIKTADSLIGLSFVVESKKVTVPIDENGTTIDYYIPVVINSDKGYPLTAQLYNELMAEQVKK